MEKFTQAPVGLDIDQTVSSNSQAITNLSNKVSKEVTNLNDQLTNLSANGNEFAYYGSSATNKPGSNSGYVQATRIGNWALQFAVDLAGTPYTRYKDAGGTITSWQELVTNSKFKTETFTGTTDSGGNIRISSVPFTKMIIGVRVVSPGNNAVYLMTYVLNGNNYWGAQFRNSSGNVLSNTSVTIDILYYDP